VPTIPKHDIPDDDRAPAVTEGLQGEDGYVDHLEFRPSPAALAVIFRHFIEQVRDLTGIVYGRRMYEVMRYWDEDRADWVAEEHDFAAAWRRQPKWVVSRYFTSTPSYLVAASHSSPAPGRRSAL
jgi:hypothetical protein